VPPVARGTTIFDPGTNGPAPARYAAGGILLSPQRARVLEHLRYAVTAATVEATAARMRMHPNTARKHLDALVERGLATRKLAPALGRGRPAWSYSAADEVPEPDPRVRDYAGLATALAAQISRTSSDPEGDALAAGEAWGRSLVANEPAGSPAQARKRVVALFAELGFDPQTDGRATTVRLRRCPLLDAARANPEVVCPVHLGITRGALAALGGDPDAVGLAAFAEPGACLLTLGLSSQTTPKSTPRSTGRTSRP
jgi:predicted ArsR family transcriptional regulator